ncbi:MAG: hypothetical protein CMP95_10025 [Gammaproteobacteria bacterium]|uniref:beta-fructofuranosidase n=1 Tax=OM182 bacterium TaxID=2510334 RepID=A0A520RX84_9GAMM|nr:hypothetical protein [Gammaproteobacteria bacterium]OUV67333.1 MAG: hypothetical protein CBC93_05695 [Gammaproteobacteria bacterium TMED133]RZO74818.1 MAG: hypothetical protein EVA68_08375 [OM182 bacterium]
MDVKSEEAEILEIMRTHSDAMKKGDFPVLLDLYSKDWRDYHGATKDSLKHRFEKTGDKEKDLSLSGNVQDIDISTAHLKIKDDKAIFTPVIHSSSGGSISYAHTLRKEADGVWRLVYTKGIDWETFPLDDEGRMDKAAIAQSALATRRFREQVMSDPHRPGYHIVSPEGFGAPFDPNGAIYWKGRYHLFYIFQDQRFGKKLDHWGHLSSTDLFHWRHHPTTLLVGMYSGNCFINKDGIPTICYHQVDKGNAMAIALDDDLNEWKKLEVITPETKEGDAYHDEYRSWDPFGWLEDDTYYAIFGGKNPGIAKSQTLKGGWHYTGDLFAHGVEGIALDEDLSCADLFKLDNRDILMGISHKIGCRYYIGEWKDEQFYPQSHAQMSWKDNSFFAPESLVDDKGRRIMWAWLMDVVHWRQGWERGWTGTMSLPRVLSISDNGMMLIDIPEEIEALRYRPFSRNNLKIEANKELTIEGIRSNSIELSIEMESEEAREYGVKVCMSPDGKEKTIISYDPLRKVIRIDASQSGAREEPKNVEEGPFSLDKNEPLKLRVFVDKSVVEVFVNRRQALMRFIYPSSNSLGISLFSEGSPTKVNRFNSWHISPSNPF